jgi:hypothetical protein
LLGALVEAGEQGLTGPTLARLVGARYGAYIARLRAAGAAIDAVPQHGSPAGEWTYRLAGRLPRELADAAAFPSAPSPDLLSARAAYLLIRSKLRDGSVEARAEIAELLRNQPELVSSRYLRHNLAGKVQLLDELARELGIADCAEQGDAGAV